MRSFKSLLMLGAMAFASASTWAFTPVSKLPTGQENKMSYVLSTPRGDLYCNSAVASANLLTTIKHNATAATTDSKFQFLLFQSKEESSGYYIYNVSLGKFLGQFSGNDVSMTDTPSLWYIFKTGKTETNQSNQVNSTTFNCADYPYCVSTSDGDFNGGAIAVSSWDCSYGTRVSGSSWDGGNQYCVAEAETVADNVWKTAYDKVVAYEANLGNQTVNSFGGEIDPTNLLEPAVKTKQEQAALDIINRFTKGEMTVDVILDLPRTTKDCDQYTYSATADELTVHASSAVAACRGFYDYVKAKGAGFCSWSGSRFTKPSDMACDEVNVVTQFRDHQYFNVVTYGYTAPFWGKARWRQELDWMALHGVDMPLMLVGSEAIYRDVFTKDFGLSDADVDAWEVGPAHLPWFRMGNLSGTSFDGPLGQEWYDNQRELAHYLLDEMDKLGMKPVCPAFGGFVPQAFSKTGTTPEVVGWNWCKPNDRNVPNYRLMPSDPKFMEVGKKFMQRWEAEYGEGKYYLSDSFNEMTIPSSTATLTQYGNNIFSIIQSSQNPKSVWVTQGWTFCYQYGDWGKAKFEALTKNVDDDRFIALYMSPEYAEHYGHARDFDTTYKGFSGKGWNCTMLPNMGGKNYWTGNLNKYAKGYLNDLYNMADHGNIVGYGMTPEGVENNEMIYELICDAGWTNPGKTVNLDEWMTQYEQSRYGKQSAEMEAFHNVLRSTVYNNYKDHPRFAWQAANIGITGSAIGASVPAAFMTGVENLFSNAEALKAANSPLLEAELIEAAAIYVGTKIEKLTAEIKAKKSDRAECTRLITCLQELMLDFDAALELHPIWNLKRWEDMAQACGDNDAVRNAKNARRIVTVWFGNHTKDEPVQDYASRIWGGLMRDYYCPRLINQLKAECGITGSFNRIAFENDFVNKAPYLSEPRAVNGDHIEFLAKLVNEAKNFGTIEAEPVDEFLASTDTENHWYAIRPAANKDNALTTAGDNAALSVAADMMESGQIWRIVATGNDTYRLESRFGFNAAVVDGAAKSYLAPVNCDVRIEKADAAQKTWTITPVAGTADLFSGNWIITDAPISVVDEAANIDYLHYVRRIAGFTQTELFGQPTEPKSLAARNGAIASLQSEAQNIDHKTFDTFLSQWSGFKAEALTASDAADVNRLAELIMGAHMIIVPADAQNSDAAATLFAAIQAAERAAVSGTNADAAHQTLTEAILAYYAAGGTVTNTDVENLAPESTGWKMKITAVFPDGTEHAVFSNGTKLTAATTAPAGAVVEFDVVKMDTDASTYVLKAGNQYLHIACGEDQSGKGKMSDFDGLSEELTEWNNLIFEAANATGTSFDKRNGSTTVIGQWDTPFDGLYQIKGMCSDNSTHYFILRSGDDQWIGADPDNRFFDSNWDGNGCRTSFFRVELIEPVGPVFPLNFDWEADATRNDRSITYIALTAEGSEEQKIDVSSTKVYSDLTETAVFTVKAGETVSGKIGYNGNWMHGYFYIDLDGDNQLTYNVNKVDQTGTEVFSYSFWSGDLSQEQSGYNSLGTLLSGDNRNTVKSNTIALPAFTAPAAGDYKVRFKVDWNSVEPGGSTSQDIIANGGFVIDAVLKVTESDVVATIGALVELIDRAKRGEATIAEINALADRILIYDLTGRRVRRLAPGSVYVVGGKRVVM